MLDWDWNPLPNNFNNSDIPCITSRCVFFILEVGSEMFSEGIGEFIMFAFKFTVDLFCLQPCNFLHEKLSSMNVFSCWWVNIISQSLTPSLSPSLLELSSGACSIESMRIPQVNNVKTSMSIAQVPSTWDLASTVDQRWRVFLPLILRMTRRETKMTMMKQMWFAIINAI